MTDVEHRNNFGFLRLLLATLVIVSHSSEIIDGNRSRELLTNLIGHRSLGELAVDGFFLISGYLIVKSYCLTPRPAAYLLKRVRRIYPGYLVAYLICILVVSPLTGGNLSSLGYKDYFRIFANGIGLQGPFETGFVGLQYPVLNGSMWTISAEFRCYILVLIAGLVGILNRRWWFLTLTAVVVLLGISGVAPDISNRTKFFLGEPATQLRLCGTFCVGGCFFLFRKEIALRADLAMAAACALLVLLYFSVYEAAAFAIFGGYILFWFAFRVRQPLLQRINSGDDISYGVYLYAWPISSLLVYFLHMQSPAYLFLATVPLAYGAGLTSWWLVEQPALKGKSRAPQKAESPAAAES